MQLLLVLVATAAVAAASRFGMLYGRANAPETQGSCCQDGVPVCSQLSRRLGIPNLGCELLCRQQGLPGSVGCSYRAPVPACGCRNDHTDADAATVPQPANAEAPLRMLPIGTLSRTRFS